MSGAPRARRRLAPKTWQRDSIVYEKHVRPMLGDRPIAALDVEDLVEWQDGLERDGVGAPTAIKAMSILSSVFREAARSAQHGCHREPRGPSREAIGKAPSPAARLARS